MNIYDFDKTIYNGDSTLDFYFFCLKRHARVWLYIPGQIAAVAGYGLKKYSKTQLKERFFRFLKCIPDIDQTIALFWAKNKCKIYDWYLQQKAADDIIISASPRFLLEPITKALKIGQLIASEVDKKSGKFYSPNCHGEEKVKRLIEIYPDVKCNEFYSDSISDLPLARLAQRCFFIKNGKRLPWNI